MKDATNVYFLDVPRLWYMMLDDLFFSTVMVVCYSSLVSWNPFTEDKRILAVWPYKLRYLIFCTSRHLYHLKKC